MVQKVVDIQIPLSVQHLDRDYDGYVFVSDIDKTYLATQIDSMAGLLRAAFETPERKRNVPGFSTVLRALRRGAGEKPQKNPLFFVSASPPQIAGKILSKMEIDGVEHDGIIFKNQMVYVRRANFKKLREQIGYKLAAFLSLWLELPQNSKLVLFGDDSESDAVVFSLVAEVLAKHIGGLDLVELLKGLGVFREEALRVAWLARRVKTPVFPVHAAFINLDTGSQPSYYARFGSFVQPSENSLQIALALFEHGLIRELAVKSIGRELFMKYDFGPKELLESLEVASQRGLFSIETLDKLWPMLHSHGVLPPPVVRQMNEGAVTRLNPHRWEHHLASVGLRALKARYSEEGRY